MAWPWTGTDHDAGFRQQIVSGPLGYKVTTVTRPDGSEKITSQVRIALKGMAALARVLSTAVQGVLLAS